MSFKPADVEAEYCKDKELRRQDVQALLEWTQKQPHLPKVTELQVVLFLQSCHFHLETAKRALDNFFTVRTLCPEIFSASLDDPLLKLTMNVTLFSVLPQRTPDGYTVIWAKLLDLNPDVYHCNTQTKLFDMVTMLDLHTHGTSKGFRIVLDINGGTLSHLPKVTLSTVKRYLYYLQEALPIRLEGIHVINVVSFIDMLMGIVKPFMKKELFELLHLHSDSIETLYEFVPKVMLPKDYGGSAPSMKQLKDDVNRNIIENFDLFVQLQQQRVVEKYRPGKPKNVSAIFGAEGTFKTLEVD